MLGAAMVRRRNRSRWVWAAAAVALGGAGVLAHLLGVL